MLGKLLKYDFKNLYKTLLSLYLITVVITILTVILNNISAQTISPNPYCEKDK